jgi:hypothetical protein
MATNKNEIKSPCINKCQLNCFDFCVGCGRTIQDIQQWLFLDDSRKLRIIKLSLDRLNNNHE